MKFWQKKHALQLHLAQLGDVLAEKDAFLHNQSLGLSLFFETAGAKPLSSFAVILSTFTAIIVSQGHELHRL